MMTQEKKIKVLFVCLGNVCRSPIAEGVFQKTVNKMNLGDKWEIDSAVAFKIGISVNLLSGKL